MRLYEENLLKMRNLLGIMILGLMKFNFNKVLKAKGLQNQEKKTV